MWRVNPIMLAGCTYLALAGHDTVQASEMSDPTAPPALVHYDKTATPSFSTKFKLHSIQKIGATYSVVINGVRKQVGDTIEEYTIQNIELNEVQLVNNRTQQRRVLSLFSTFTDSIQQPGG
jgi:hypothetical protein